MANQTKLAIAGHLYCGHFIRTNYLLMQLILALKGPYVNDRRLFDGANYHLIFDQIETMPLDNTGALVSDQIVGRH